MNLTASATCEWVLDEDGRYDTQCDHAFEFIKDGVTRNGFKFCPFCGGKIVEKPRHIEPE